MRKLDPVHQLVTLAVLIFCFSIFGRQIMESLQSWGFSFLLLGTLATGVLLLLFTRNLDENIILSFNLLLGAGAWYFGQIHHNEAAHFLFFGLFGIIAARLALTHAILSALFIGFLDELLQYFLPYRVGEFRDVVLNWICAFLPLSLVRIRTYLKKKK